MNCSVTLIYHLRHIIYCIHAFMKQSRPGVTVVKICNVEFSAWYGVFNVDHLYKPIKNIMVNIKHKIKWLRYFTHQFVRMLIK
ncbi:hypothetical protein A9R13_26990 [Klebsiella pneumoniae]|nr:hypothetical protein A9R13_26990 [Klebsiella pneumoniae]